MIQRLYIHNFRCLENFELSLHTMSSALLIGKNGAGKSTIAAALTIFQQIGQRHNRIGELIKLTDFTRENTAIPMRFELEIILKSKVFKYKLAFELPSNFIEPKIVEESISVDGEILCNRNQGNVTLSRRGDEGAETRFVVDWHLVALPIIQKQAQDPLHILQEWLGNMLILAPIPRYMRGDSSAITLQPNHEVSNFGDWVTGLLIQYPAAYGPISKYMQEVMPDFDSIENEPIGKNAKNMVLKFENGTSQYSIEFNHLSDGEKCFMLCAVVLAANKYYDSLFCFWDEPDNYLALPEVGHFVITLRRAFSKGSQLLVSSHNDEAIRSFPSEAIFVMDRKSHLEPTLIQPLNELGVQGDLIRHLIAGDIAL